MSTTYSMVVLYSAIIELYLKALIHSLEVVVSQGNRCMDTLGSFRQLFPQQTHASPGILKEILSYVRIFL